MPDKRLTIKREQTVIGGPVKDLTGKTDETSVQEAIEMSVNAVLTYAKQACEMEQQKAAMLAEIVANVPEAAEYVKRKQAEAAGLSPGGIVIAH
jgi:hypothetical protein